jgi:phenylalanyl-tRNA synthetase beta chain
MRLLLSWVRDFVDVAASPHEVADRLGLRGFEVASVEPLGTSDGVVDFEVTANRPDCLSVLGFAREIATAFDLPLRPPSAEAGAVVPLASVPVGASDRVRVALEDAESCPRYAAAVADLTPATTPSWMGDRLRAAGVRPINPIVDVTNYVLMELGHPMHAFDLATLAGAEVRIRRASAGERLTTLDNVERRLDHEMLVIADAERAQAVAGVMGGAASEVSDRTRTIVFESAYFKPASVRRTSKRLGLKSEASARFERGADVNAPVIALQRAITLMQAIGAGRPTGAIVDRYPVPRGPRTIGLRRSRLERVLGTTVPDRDVMRILEGLGLTVGQTPEGWQVVVPTFRVDLVREVDLIEDVGRHHGFDRIEPAFPAVTVGAPPPDERIARDALVRRVLTAAGLSEAVTFGFIEAGPAAAFAPGGAGAVVPVANPLSAKFEVLRPSLLPGLVDAAAYNRRHGRRDVALFEIGARFTSISGESRGVAFAWTGAGFPEHWSGTGRDVDFFDGKGIVERLGRAMGVEVHFEPAAIPFLVPGQAANVLTDGVPAGRVGLLAPGLIEAAGAPRADRLVVGELDLDRLRGRRTEQVQALPRYPFIVRDLSIVVADALPVEIIRGTIRAAGLTGAAPLVAVDVFDRYRGTGVPDGAVSLSLRLTFQAADRTLTDAEAQQSFDAIVSRLAREHGAVQR